MPPVLTLTGSRRCPSGGALPSTTWERGNKRTFFSGDLSLKNRMQGAKISFAIVAICLVLAIYANPLIHRLGGSDPCSAEWVNGTIHVSSRTELLDSFMKAHRILDEQGFHPAAQPPSPLAMKSGMITPDMVTLYYAGSYQGSQPFGFRLDIDRSGNNLVPYVEPSGPDKAAFELQEKDARAFLDLFIEKMKSPGLAGN